MEIKIEILNKRATVEGAPVIICGNSDYTIKFTFDGEWEGQATKTARFVFVRDGTMRYVDVIFKGNTVAVPTLFNTKEVMVGVFSGDLRTSMPARIPCEFSIRCGTGAPEDPTPSQYDQIMQLLNYGVTSADVAAAVEVYFQKNPVENLTEANIAAAVSAYFQEHPVEGVTDSDIVAAVEDYLQKHPVEGEVGDAVLYGSQKLTEEQQAQARENIGAPSALDIQTAAASATIQALEDAEATGVFDGKNGYTPVKGIDYWTEEDMEEIYAASVVLISSELAKRGQLKPEFANSKEECTDTTKLYVLPDGNIYAYMLKEIEGEKADFGVVSMDKVATPYTSTKTAYSFQETGATISGNLKSITLKCESANISIKCAIAHMNGSVITSIDEIALTTKAGTNTYINGVDFNYSGTVNVGDLIGFNMNTVFRICYATIDSPNQCLTTTSLTDLTYAQKTYGFGISASVEQPSTSGYTWCNTGHAFVPADYEKRIIALEDAVKGFALDVDVNISNFNLANPAVSEYVNGVDYEDTSYDTTQVTNYTAAEGYRKDLPTPVLLNWNGVPNAVQYAVRVGTQIYNTEHNRIAVYNLVPNTIYAYSVTALLNNGTMTLAAEGTFGTESGTRMLNIDGVQNVRDIGGYIVGDTFVKYGLIFRGSAMDEDVASTLCITDKGKQQLLKEVGVKAELDLRADKTTSALGVGVDFKNVPYGSKPVYDTYTTVLTNSAHKEYFKTAFEHIVQQLQANKPIYIHCSGGCDRTGILVFLLLGLLGVSESDLAKEYELSSFSKIGVGRTRKSTTYDYKGIVNVIKGYSGSTLKDKFVDYAEACGISSDTIASFRSIMIS